jgi:hypothetical protein
MLKQIVESFTAEFLESLIVWQEASSQSVFVTVSCLTDDGLIDESDLREVMKACMVENGMQFDEKEVASLANALFEDAVQVGRQRHPLLCTAASEPRAAHNGLNIFPPSKDSFSVRMTRQASLWMTSRIS